RAYLSPEVDSPLWSLLDGLDARVALVEGDLERADAITKTLAPTPRRSRAEARRLIASGAPDAALDVLAGTVASTPRERVDLLLLRARCEDALASANADASLADAVDAARAEGFNFALVEELFPLSHRLGTLLH